MKFSGTQHPFNSVSSSSEPTKCVTPVVASGSAGKDVKLAEEGMHRQISRLVVSMQW